MGLAQLKPTTPSVVKKVALDQSSKEYKFMAITCGRLAKISSEREMRWDDDWCLELTERNTIN